MTQLELFPQAIVPRPVIRAMRKMTPDEVTAIAKTMTHNQLIFAHKRLTR